MNQSIDHPNAQVSPMPPIAPTQRADQVAKAILHTQFATLLANLDGVRAQRNPECLHDLRVATRRIRSALTQIKDVFPDDLAEPFKSRFAWLQQVTNPLRDLDVYLLHFDDDRQRLPASLRANLEPLRDYLVALYAREQRDLTDALASAQFARLIEDWRAFLNTPLPEVSRTANGMRSIKDLADERIWRLTRRVRRDGLALHADSPPEDLHELRKSCKKLRYLIEFFQIFYPERDISRSIRILKSLLDRLGAIQDLTVQIRYLSTLAQRMRDEDRAPTDTLLAMGALIGQLLERQQALRNKFSVVFADYLDADHQTALRSLFASGHLAPLPAGERG